MSEKRRGPGRPPGSKNKNTSSRSTQTKSTKGSQTKSTRKRTEKERELERNVRQMEARYDAKAQLRDEIIGVLLIALGVFMFVALQTKAAGNVGVVLSHVLKGCFGFTAYILPYYFLIYGILLFMKKMIHVGIKSIILLVLMFLSLSLMNAGRFLMVGEIGYHSIKESYANGIALKDGGVFGMGLGHLLVEWIGTSGLYISSVVVLFICLLLLVNTPVARFFEQFKQRRQRKEIEKQERAKQEAAEIEAMRNARLMEAQKYNQIPETTGAMTDNQRKIMGYVQENEAEAAPEPEPAPAEEKKSRLGIGRGRKKKSDTINDPDGKLARDISIVTAETPKLTNAEAEKSTLASTDFNNEFDGDAYEFPAIDLLNKPKKAAIGSGDDEASLRAKAIKLEDTLASFGISAQVTNVSQGPAVTRYEVHPDSGVKVKGIKSLADDIALNMEAKSIRIEAPIPGKPAVGIEIENNKIKMVTAREIIESNEFKSAESKITFAVGKDIAGKAIVADLKSMPHLLIAGSTGSGKSVCVNSIITSILYKSRPDEVKLVLIDPKVVELSNYNGIPHLLIPVVTDTSKAAAALNWAVAEMDDRYRQFAEVGARDLASYNAYLTKLAKKAKEDEVITKPLPQVVIIIDELADLMMAAPSQVEDSICRLAQKARAAGMHLIVATQRPSVDVITGVIKANIPSRIAFAVSSQVDSRTIIDMSGAEKLVGKGDMLFNPLGTGKPIRVQGCFISDSEVNKVIDFVKQQVPEAEYENEVIDKIERANIPDAEKDNRDTMGDELLPDAIELVVSAGQASVSMLQRRFRIGYNRAARIIDMMEDRQIVGPSEGSKPRMVLISEEELQIMKEQTEDL